MPNTGRKLLLPMKCMNPSRLHLAGPLDHYLEPWGLHLCGSEEKQAWTQECENPPMQNSPNRMRHTRRRDRLVHSGLTFNSWYWGMSTWTSGVFENFAWNQVGLDFGAPKKGGFSIIGVTVTPGPNMPIWVCLRRATSFGKVFEKIESVPRGRVARRGFS